MILHEDVQTALLFILYLSRSGQADIYDIAHELKISVYDLMHVSEALRTSGIIVADPDNDREFSLLSDPTVSDVFRSMGFPHVLSGSQAATNLTRGVEGRTLNYLADAIQFNIQDVLRSSVRFVGENLTRYELSLLNSEGMSEENN